MKKVLFTATVDSHILHFHMRDIKWFKDQGYQVHVASNGADFIEGVDKKFNVPFQREPWNIDAVSAYTLLKAILKANHYDIIHCHTPMGAVLTRLASRKLRREGVKVLYTAHGFHFFKGSPVMNWVVYYPVEKLMSRFTDCLITINPEDFQAAHQHKFKAEAIKYVHGVGVDLTKFHPVSTEEKYLKRKAMGIEADAFVISLVGELSHRKNQMVAIKAINQLISEMPKIHLLIIGEGDKEKELKLKVEEYKLDHAVSFLGYRKDIDALLQVSDVLVSCARQEGLPVNVMEAMASGLPIIATDCRGNRDLVSNHFNGFKVSIDDEKGLSKAISDLYHHSELRARMGRRSIGIMSAYSEAAIRKELTEVYAGYMSQEVLPETGEGQSAEVIPLPLAATKPYESELDAQMRATTQEGSMNG